MKLHILYTKLDFFYDPDYLVDEIDIREVNNQLTIKLLAFNSTLDPLDVCKITFIYENKKNETK